MVRMRERHTHGEAQVQQLFSMVRGFADSYDDVNFTPPHLATITADTLIVFGDRDPLYPVSLAFDLHRAIPRSYLWVVPNGGHGPVLRERRRRRSRARRWRSCGDGGGPGSPEGLRYEPSTLNAETAEPAERNILMLRILCELCGLCVLTSSRPSALQGRW